MTNKQRATFELALGLVFGAAIWARAAPPAKQVPDVIRAREFQVVDDKGEVRAAMRMDSGDGPKVTLWNAHRQKAAELRLDDASGQTALVLAGKTGKHQVTILTHEDQGPGINLATERGSQARLLMGVGPGGEPYVYLNDKRLEAVRK